MKNKQILAWLTPSMISTTKSNEVTIKLGWYYTGTFSVPEWGIPKQEQLAIFTVSDKEIVSVDALYLEKPAFTLARLFGPAIGRRDISKEVQPEFYARLIPLPRREIAIRVVKYNGEVFFNIGNVFFDLLSAEDQHFIDGQLTIMRKGKIFDQTTMITEVGTHAACLCFCGLERLFRGTYWGHAVNALSADQLKVGDRLILTISAPQEYDYEANLIEVYQYQKALRESLQGHPDGIGMQALVAEVQKTVAEAPAVDVAHPIILRYSTI